MARPKNTKNIETPQKMWELYQAYKASVKDNPRYKCVFVGKDGDEKRERLERPLTMEGFELYCVDNIGYVHQYFVNQDGLYDDYMNICSRIRMDIRQDQIEGGMVGQYNPSITQRLNNLVDKVQTTIVEQPLFPDVPTDNSGQ